MDNLNSIVDFLFEAGMLAKTPRSGFYFLGSGRQSVAEHVHRVALIGYVLAMSEPQADLAKVLKMCLLHDFPEARTSDLNYVHQKYAKANVTEVLNDLVPTVPFGQDIKATVEEFEARQSLEAKLAKDADNLEWILSLKEQVDIGNQRAESWMPFAINRLNTDLARQIAAKALEINSDHWWFGDGDDNEWWSYRKKRDLLRVC
ncbi:HD domain-containing protein [Candidatus Falkowbacteria bacterium]|nr:HD domain-containing protein [Candidatus Falkowbacteria bacterium]